MGDSDGEELAQSVSRGPVRGETSVGEGGEVSAGHCLHEVVSCGEVPVEGADADAGCCRDPAHVRAHSLLAQDLCGGLDDAGAVGDRVASLSALPDHRPMI